MPFYQSCIIKPIIEQFTREFSSQFTLAEQQALVDATEISEELTKQFSDFCHTNFARLAKDSPVARTDREVAKNVVDLVRNHLWPISAMKANNNLINNWVESWDRLPHDLAIIKSWLQFPQKSNHKIAEQLSEKVTFKIDAAYVRSVVTNFEQQLAYINPADLRLNGLDKAATRKFILKEINDASQRAPLRMAANSQIVAAIVEDCRKHKSFDIDFYIKSLPKVYTSSFEPIKPDDIYYPILQKYIDCYKVSQSRKRFHQWDYYKQQLARQYLCTQAVIKELQKIQAAKQVSDTAATPSSSASSTTMTSTTETQQLPPSSTASVITTMAASTSTTSTPGQQNNKLILEVRKYLAEQDSVARQVMARHLTKNEALDTMEGYAEDSHEPIRKQLIAYKNQLNPADPRFAKPASFFAAIFSNSYGISATSPFFTKTAPITTAAITPLWQGVSADSNSLTFTFDCDLYAQRFKQVGRYTAADPSQHRLARITLSDLSLASIDSFLAKLTAAEKSKEGVADVIKTLQTQAPLVTQAPSFFKAAQNSDKASKMAKTFAQLRTAIIKPVTQAPALLMVE